MLKGGTDNLLPLTTNGKVMIASAGVAASTTEPSLWQWLGTHNESITSVCAIITVLVTVVGFFITVFRSRT